MHRSCYLLLAIFSWLVTTTVFASTQCENNTRFKVGTGIYDITGPAAEEGMMGYAMVNQKTAGLLQRLWARAFVIESPCNGKRVVFVNADLGQLFQGIKLQVVRKLQEKYGSRYTHENVLLTATHTHSGPGGYSTYALYNLTTLGFSRAHFDAIVAGIVAAIERAENNLTPAAIHLANGELPGISYNRSPQAYLLNPSVERARYAADTDTRMTLLRFDSQFGKPLGMINWFPLHGVSMNNKNLLINGDNKGYAEYLFEKDFKSDYGTHAYVAAFAQAHAGDVSPNEYGHEGGAGVEGIHAVEKAGDAQYAKAKELYQQAQTVVTGGVDFIHTYVTLDDVVIMPEYTDGQLQKTCTAAIGVSMLAGTQDGEGVGAQGTTCDDVMQTLPVFVCEHTTTSCQGVKPIALETGSKKPYPWTPNILPLQLLKIGQVVIVAVPTEVTTMSGRRLTETIAKQFPANTQVVLSTLANAYAGYLATPEEYQMQRYEGASTHFGPWQLAALQQEYTKLARALTTGQSVSTGATPLDLLDEQMNLQTDVVLDDKPLFKNFGDVYEDVHAHYQAGENVSVTFWGGHPKNNYHDQDTFLAVQQLEQGQWQTIRQDRDWDTEYHWQRQGLMYSLVTIIWRIPVDIAPGQYRILHFGEWKSGWNGEITSYVGTSGIFTI